MSRNSLPLLDFDSSGSASVRFSGLIAEVGIHYANAKISMTKMVCPRSINISFPCPVCNSGTAMAPRRLAIGWDCKLKRWCTYLAPSTVFEEIFSQCKAAGVTAKMMADGDGPEVVLQRIGIRTEVVILPETIGKSKPEAMDFEADLVLKEIGKKSVYRTASSIAEVEKMYSKTEPSPASPGYSSYLGSIGYSGPVGYSGVMGYSSAALGLVGHRDSGPSLPPRWAETQDKPRIMAEAQPDALKVKPRLKSIEPNEPRDDQDRWDLIG